MDENYSNNLDFYSQKESSCLGTEQEESTTIGGILTNEMGMGMTIQAIKSYAC